MNDASGSENPGEDAKEKSPLADQKLGLYGATNAKGLIVDLIDQVNLFAEDSSMEVTGLRTGFADIDRATTGLQPGDLVVVASRTSMGKTAFALNIATNVAVKEDLPVLIFTLESTASQTMAQVIASHARIDRTRMRIAKFDDMEWERFTEAVDVIADKSLFIDDTPGLTLDQLLETARLHAKQSGRLGLIVLDYLQMMHGARSNGDDSRSTELGEITRGLKTLAKELACPVIALSQINRNVEMRENKRPKLSDLRDCGSIEDDADCVMMIYRDDYYTGGDSMEPGIAEIIIAKQRRGETGMVKLAFIRSIARFETLYLSAAGY